MPDLTQEETDQLVATIWAAGFFDGEGSVVWTVNNGNTISHLSVGNTGKECLEFLQKWFQGSITIPRPTRSNNKVPAIWQVNGNNAENFARAILPFSIEKREQLLVWLEARKLIDTVKRGRGTTMNSKQLELRKEYEILLRTLKKCGSFTYEGHDSPNS